MQWLRLYLDSATGAILHLHVQETPIAHQPLSEPGRALEVRDAVIERRPGERFRARWLIANLEATADGGVRMKAEVPAALRRTVRRIGPPA
ncbi:MAG: hypothetical protein HY521_14950 [Proteobacteria bacterium]|nr:hypothetical protein [Pseudomonadota bacterium]